MAVAVAPEPWEPLAVIVAILLRPNFLVNLSNTYLGNVIFILLVVGLTFYDKLCGLLLLLMVISFKQIELEGMESSKENGISSFRKRYCEGSIFFYRIHEFIAFSLMFCESEFDL